MVDEHAKEAARGPEDSMNPLAPRRLTNAPGRSTAFTETANGRSHFIKRKNYGGTTTEPHPAQGFREKAKNQGGRYVCALLQNGLLLNP
jgi:hypothetical protein